MTFAPWRQMLAATAVFAMVLSLVPFDAYATHEGGPVDPGGPHPIMDVCHIPGAVEVLVGLPLPAALSHVSQHGDFIIETPEDLARCLAMIPTTGILIVEKVIAGEATDSVASDFTFTVNGGDPIQFDDDGVNDDVVVSLLDAPFAVVEVEADGSDYTTDYVGCDAMGDEDSCVITNTYLPPPASLCSRRYR